MRTKANVRNEGPVDDEFKKNVVKLNYASPKTTSQIADDFEIKTERLYAWRRKYTADGDKTPAAVQNDELKKLRPENAELKIERDMLKRPPPSRTLRVPAGRPSADARLRRGVPTSRACTIESIRFSRYVYWLL